MIMIASTFTRLPDHTVVAITGLILILLLGFGFYGAHRAFQQRAFRIKTKKIM
jgi:hypothetical protein